MSAIYKFHAEAPSPATRKGGATGSIPSQTISLTVKGLRFLHLANYSKRSGMKFKVQVREAD